MKVNINAAKAMNVYKSWKLDVTKIPFTAMRNMMEIYLVPIVAQSSLASLTFSFLFSASQ